MSEKNPFVSSQEHRLNPNCAIRYEVDSDGNITDIVADGNQEEAEAMAIHYLGKNVRRGLGDLNGYILMLAGAAMAKENPMSENGGCEE